MTYSRCSINICWTKLNWIKFIQTGLIFPGESLHIQVCTREREWICGTWVNAYGELVHACLEQISMFEHGSVCMLWTCPGMSEFKVQGGNVQCVCTHMCMSVHTCVPASTALSCMQQTWWLPGFGSASFLPGKPGEAKISTKMVVFG